MPLDIQVSGKTAVERSVSWPRIQAEAERWMRQHVGPGSSGQTAIVLHWHDGRWVGFHFELKASRLDP